MSRHRVDGRAVALFIVLDLLSYALLYWLVLPAFEPVLGALDPVTVTALGHVLTAVRLTFLGAVAVRSVRTRHGLPTRSDAVPSVLVAAVGGWLVHLVLGVVVGLVVDVPGWSWGMLLALVEWVGFALIGAMFVNPGPAEAGLPLRFRRMAQRETGSVSLFLVPATAAILAVTVLVIVVLGSATNDRREASTAADAAALAAGQVWEDSLGSRFAVIRAASAHDAFWDLAGNSLAVLTPEAAMRTAAAQLAARNDAELVDLSVDHARATVTVRVRSLDTVPQSTTRMAATASSRLEFRSGLCRSGGTIGYLISGSCVTSAPVVPTPTPTPTPDPEDPADPAPTEPPPPPFEIPAGLGSWGMDVVLTAR